MDEVWKVVTYAPNYEISNFANIRNKKTNKLLKINYDKLKQTNTRARPYLSHHGKSKGYYLHRIVAEHFIDNPNNLPEVNHINGDMYDNSSVNLEWISKDKNMKHANEKNLISRYKRRVIVTNKITGEVNVYNSVTDCANSLGYHNSYICNICRNKFENTNYNIKYLEEERSLNNNDNAIWKSYPENDKYLVSNMGEIKNIKTGRLMMGSKVNGYRFVTLYVGRSKPKLNRLIHRMVAQTFLENPDNKLVVNHKDTNILNNHVDNLEWVTYKENMNTSETKNNLKRGKKSKKILQIKIDNGEIINEFYGASEGEEVTGISSTNILKICNYYAGNNKYGGSSTWKTYQKSYIFIFEDYKDNIDKCLELAKSKNKSINGSGYNIHQYDKLSNVLIQSFNSCTEAAKILNIKMCGINQCCQYHKYTDSERPECYKLKTYKGFIFKYVRIIGTSI